MNKHILIAFSILSLILLSLGSCQQEALDTVVPEDTRTVGIHLNTETGEMTEVDYSQLHSAVTAKQQEEITERSNYYFYSDRRYHRSQGSISNNGILKRLKWDVTHDYEYNKPSGQVNKFVIQDGHKVLDLDMKVVCNYVSEYDRSEAIFMGRVTEINEQHPYFNWVKKGDFIYFSMTDGGEADKTDYLSGFNIVSRRVLDDALADFNFVRRDFCFMVGYFDNVIDDYLRLGDQYSIPSDDWLKVRDFN